MSRSCLRVVTGVGFAALLCDASAVFAQTAPSLGAARSFAVLGGSGVTNTGPSVINGDLGSNPTAPTAGQFGGPPNATVNGAFHPAADGATLLAQGAAFSAYGALTGQACNTTFGVPTVIGTGGAPISFTPGVRCFTTSAQVTGNLTLDALGNPNAVFIFVVGTTLGTAVGSSVTLINGAQPCNVFWAVGVTASLTGASTFVGNILTNTGSITMTAGVHLFGRALTQAAGAVTMDTDTVDATVCSAPTGGAICAVPGVSPIITTIPNQVIPSLPAHGSAVVPFTIGGRIIVDALVVRATSSDLTLVPQSAMTITNGVNGARVLTIFGADGRSGVATITVSVTDPTTGCVTSTAFLLTVGATAVPTLPEWAMIALMTLLAMAGFAAVRRRAT
jgi:Ice-binding-like/IPTL-CTERM motif